MRWRIGTAVVAGVLALALVLHVPLIRGAVLSYARAAAERDFGLLVDVGRLDYNLAVLRVGVASIRISAPGFESEPFFEAEYVSFTLPFGALLGAIAFTDVTVTDARVVVHRHGDGTINLPASADGPDVEPPALRIARLDIPRLTLDLRDDRTESSLQVPALALILTPDDGTVSLDMPADLSVATRQTHVSHVQGQAQFDGRVLRVTNVELLTDEASVTLDGAFEVLTRVPRLDVRLTGTGDIAGLARWGLTDTELPQGTIAFDGTVAGPTDSLEARMKLSAERVTWRDATTEGLVARVRVDPVATDMQELRARFAGGTLTASATLPFAGGMVSHLAASWSRVDAASAVSAAIPDLRVVPAAQLSGEIEIDGVLADAATWSGALQLQMEPEPNSQGRISMAGGLTLVVDDGTWRLEGQPTLAGIAPIQIGVGGYLGDGPERPQALQGAADPAPAPQQGIGADTIDGTVRLFSTDVPGLFAALRTVGIAMIANDTVTAGILAADIAVGGRLADPTVGADAVVRDLAGAQVGVAALSVRVEGRPLQPWLTFGVETPGGVVAGQRVDEVRATGLITGTSIVLDELSANQPTGPGRLTGRGAYDVTTGEYSASIESKEWVIGPTAEQPLTGRLSASFEGSGTAMDPSGTGRVTLTDASWKNTTLGDFDASVQLEGRVANIDARAPAFDATATARVRLDAPHTLVLTHAQVASTWREC